MTQILEDKYNFKKWNWGGKNTRFSQGVAEFQECLDYVEKSHVVGTQYLWEKVVEDDVDS